MGKVCRTRQGRKSHSDGWAENRTSFVGDLEIFTGMDDKDTHRGAWCPNLSVDFANGLVSRRVHFNAKEPEGLCGSPTDLCTALADAAGKRESVKPTKGGRHGRDLRDQTVTVDLDGKEGRRIASSSGRKHRSHVATRDAREPRKARAAIQPSFELVEVEVELSGDGDQCAWVDRT